MKNLILDQTKTTPSIFLNKSGILIITGRSLPEDSIKFYKPIIDKFKEICKVNNNVQITLELEYVNTSSSKVLLDLLKTPFIMGKECSIIWSYEEGDDDIQELGEFYEEILKTNFSYKILHY